MSNKSRLVHFDLMRIIACFFVIVIHIGICGQSKSWSSNSYNTIISNFYGIISRWAVPCFVMLSGAMFLNQNREVPLKKLYGKYILRLAVSYVFWSVVYALYNMLYETNGTFLGMAKYFINNFLSGETHMWYVLMTIGLYIITPILRIIIEKAPKQIIKYWLIIMFIFASIIPFIVDLNIPLVSGTISYLNKYMELYFVMGYILYYVIGHYLINVGLSNKTKRIIYIGSMVSFLYCMFILVFLRLFTDITMGALSYLYPNIIFIGMAVLLFFNDKISKIHFSKTVERIIIRYSGLSYGVFLIHVLIIKLLYHIGINLSITNVAISIPLVSFIVFIVSSVIIFVISKIPFVNKYII